MNRSTSPEGVDPAHPDDLTMRLLAQLAAGATTADAAAACGVSESTLNRRLQALRQEWGLQTNIQAVVLAVRRGLL